MKDKKLEQQFEEYFKGVNAPDNITGDAKKYVRQKRNIMPKIVKFASVAASFALIIAVAVTIVLKSNFIKPDEGNPPTSPDISDGTSNFAIYTDAELTTIDANPYNLSLIDSSLKFIENFAFASNASVSECKLSYRDGAFTLARAKISVLNNMVRDETEVFVEFTERDFIYNELKKYYDGEIYTYRGASYYLTQSIAENGEPQSRLHIYYGGVKYYFDVTSSDNKAYEKYLNLIVK